MNQPAPTINGALITLRQFVQRPARKPAEQRCELCCLELTPTHEHLIEPATRNLVCSCTACAMLFSGQTSSEVKYRRVPTRLVSLSKFELSDEAWNALGVPINLAFFFRSSLEGQVVALYPSPAGATEARVESESWVRLVEQNPALESLETDTECLLVNRMRDAHNHFIAPIDHCFKLVGLIRVHWRGLSGGLEVWEQVSEFFEDLQRQAQLPGDDHDA